MQIKRITLGGIIMTVIMFSGCSTTVQNLAIREEKNAGNRKNRARERDREGYQYE